MNAIDEFEAFARMMEVDGQSPETIAKTFGTTVAAVKGRLRYGLIHPDIRAAARAKPLHGRIDEALREPVAGDEGAAGHQRHANRTVWRRQEERAVHEGRGKMTLKPRCLGCGQEIELDAGEYRYYRGPVPCPHCYAVTDMVFEDGHLLTSGTGQLKKLGEGDSIEFSRRDAGGVAVVLGTDGRLWVNDSTHCVVRVSGLPSDATVLYDPEGGFLDISISRSATAKEEEREVKEVWWAQTDRGRRPFLTHLALDGVTLCGRMMWSRPGSAVWHGVGRPTEEGTCPSCRRHKRFEEYRAREGR